MIDKSIPAWRLNANTYCAQQGVHVPWIAEISPAQYASLSRRGKAEHDAKRAREWQAAADCKEEWRRKVCAAYDAGEFQKDTSGVHPDAWGAVVASRAAEREASKTAAWLEYERANHITTPTHVAVGDRIFDVLCRRYVKVLKLFPKGIRVQPETPGYQGDAMKPITRPATMFDRLSYNDAKAAFEATFSDS